ncbi:DUF6382 domain-containing protein [[Ruminococcus] lactaris]|uniref:DUF6382 domain-containing protein n=1 Tax=[Ruminococcus] lactaris TaxID=46228 RepID=UPI00242A5B56|nr:DUF6382 domain-containing protein [[Ruminococcus] lactaris]
MREFQFENQGANTYLIYQFAENEGIDTMSLGMLTNNHISGLASAVYYQLDEVRAVKYNITAKVSLDQFFTGVVNKKRVLGVLNGIIQAMLEMEDYMMNPETIVIDPKYMFVNVTTCEMALISIPTTELDEERVNLGAFFKDLVFTAQFDQNENCGYVAQLLNFFNNNTNFSLIEFKALLDTLNQSGTLEQQRTIPARNTPQRPPVQRPAGEVTIPGQQQRPAGEMTIPGQQQPVGGMAIPGKQPVGGMAIPGKQPVRGTVNQNQPQENPVNSGEKPMSRFYLLQHYSKKNAAIYKAQKAEKKLEKEANKKKKKGKKNTIDDGSFTVPGAPVTTNPKQMEQSFAEPVKQNIPSMQNNIPINNVISNNQGTFQGTYAVPQSLQRTGYQSQGAEYKEPQYQNPPINFGETTVLSMAPAGETSVLGPTEMQSLQGAFLLRMKNNERIPLNKPVFRIGKERSYVDYFIGDNPAISRSHVNIINRDGNYFVVDTNSTNHTFVNGNMIQSNVEVPLTHGTCLRLGNEEFEFKVM